MNCDICGKNQALYHIKTRVNNAVRTLNLCGECASTLGIAQKGEKLEFSLSGLLDNLKEHGKKENPDLQEACLSCGRPLQEILKDGKAGCPQCYLIFHREIADYLSEEIGFTEHTGRLPKAVGRLKELLTDRKELEKQLEDAVNEEKYEQAAELRDRIHQLEPVLRQAEESCRHDRNES